MMNEVRKNLISGSSMDLSNLYGKIVRASVPKNSRISIQSTADKLIPIRIIRVCPSGAIKQIVMNHTQETINTRN
jgi:hypothetical protein